MSEPSRSSESLRCHTCYDWRGHLGLGDRRKLDDFEQNKSLCLSCSLICAVLADYEVQIGASRDHTIEVQRDDGVAWLCIHLDSSMMTLEVTAQDSMFSASS